jgi:hypothetical protein
VVARLFRISSPFHRQVESDVEHIEILDAVLRRDVQAAQSAMLGIPVDRDRSFRPIVTDDSGLS